ncbi:hypothetical protein Droror1_Dr00017926 [Drosera rotundifolia]
MQSGLIIRKRKTACGDGDANLLPLVVECGGSSLLVVVVVVLLVVGRGGTKEWWPDGKEKECRWWRLVVGGAEDFEVCDLIVLFSRTFRLPFVVVVVVFALGIGGGVSSDASVSAWYSKSSNSTSSTSLVKKALATAFFFFSLARKAWAFLG